MRHRGVTRCAKRLCPFAHLFIYVRIAQLFMRHTVLRSSRMRWCNPLLTLALAVLGCVASVYPPLHAQANAKWTIKGVLGMMDKSAQDFHTLTADLEHVKYTAVVKDTSTETGHIFVRHDEKMRIEITKPDPRTILREGDNLFLFNTKINRVEEYNLGKNRQMVDQYVLLGFSKKGENTETRYVVSRVEEEDFDSKKTVVLELTPKSDAIRTQISKIQMCVDEASW